MSNGLFFLTLSKDLKMVREHARIRVTDIQGRSLVVLRDVITEYGDTASFNKEAEKLGVKAYMSRCKLESITPAQIADISVTMIPSPF